ncbi:MAG: preprotein translocase subunit SecE [Clostridia bacterium]|nr:preprotein translocase subunit SecE [Clostridia bacterium]
MAENTDKDALKAAKDAEKAAKKAKQERIRQSKPKKDGNAFSRAGKAVKKFFKDFTGTCKKIVWPTGKQVVKNSLVVLATIIVIGAVVALIDFGLTKIFDLGEQGVVALAEYVGGEEETTEAETSLDEAISEGAQALEGLETEAAEDETAEAAEETTEAAEEETAG